MSRTGPRGLTPLAVALLVAVGSLQSAAALTILLKDGRRLQGNAAPVGGLAENPQSPKASDVKSILVVDDDLKRIFVPTFRMEKILEADSGEVSEKIAVKQRVARDVGGAFSRVGRLVKMTPFDEFGRCTITMMTGKGQLNVVMGITMITPVCTRVEGLVATGRPVAWDMRIATNSIPRETLHQILANSIDPKSLEQRLRVVRLFVQSDRYLDAQRELQGVIADFPQHENLTKEVQALRQLYARDRQGDRSSPQGGAAYARTADAQQLSVARRYRRSAGASSRDGRTVSRDAAANRPGAARAGRARGNDQGR